MSKITVLVAEDHTIVRQGIVSLLNKEDNIIVVGEARNGREAIKLCQDKRPDIVVMDMAMPNLNGIEATKIITKNCPGIKIIILSMYSEEEYILKAMKAGASGYLIKKSAADDLINALFAVNEGKIFFSSEVSKTFMESWHGLLDKIETIDSAANKNKLSSREVEVLQLLAEGYTSKKISNELFISPSTVQRHRENIMKKTNIHDVAGLTRYAMENGIIHNN